MSSPLTMTLVLLSLLPTAGAVSRGSTLSISSEMQSVVWTMLLGDQTERRRCRCGLRRTPGSGKQELQRLSQALARQRDWTEVKLQCRSMAISRRIRMKDRCQLKGLQERPNRYG